MNKEFECFSTINILSSVPMVNVTDNVINSGRNDPIIKNKADYIIEWPTLVSYSTIERALSSYVDNFLTWLDEHERTKR